MATEPVTSNRNRFVVSCVIALGVLLVLFVVVMVFENPAWAFYLFGTSKKFEILKFLGIGMGGVLLTLQVWMSHKRAKAMEDAATAQSEATKEQAKANRNIEQGQRQERLKNAIKHLGHRSDNLLGLMALNRELVGRGTRSAVRHPHSSQQEPGVGDRRHPVSSAGKAEPETLGALQELPLSGRDLEQTAAHRSEG